jgi:hypothetical protein
LTKYFQICVIALVLVLALSGCKLFEKLPGRLEKSDIIKGTYDVIIIGSELEGIYLARAATDEGLHVLVLDPRDKVGGQLLQAEMFFLDEQHDHKRNSLLQGDVKKLFEQFKSGKVRKASEFASYYKELTHDIPILSGVQIQTIATKSYHEMDQIKSLTYKDKQGNTNTVQASYWVENTDFNALTSKLNVVRIPGIETIYHEPQIDYMAATMMMKFKNVNWATLKKATSGLTQGERFKKYGDNTTVNDTFVTGFSNIMTKYHTTTDDLFLRGFNGINQRDGEVIVNALLVYNVNPSIDASINGAMDKAKSEMSRVLNFLKVNMPGWNNAELNGFPEYLYIREYNHFETEYILQMSDLMSSKMFWDNVSIGGYPIDMQGTKANKWGTQLGKPDRYGMPLRSFELKGYENVLVAGKNVGAAEDAYGSARIQANTSLAAQTTGIVLGRLKNGKRLRQLNEADFKQLHEYMRKKYTINIE